MKILSNYKIIVSFVLVIFLASCEDDFLVEQPRLSQSNELTLSTLEGLEKSIVGSYGLFCDYEWYGTGMVAFGDLRGGLAKRGSSNSGRLVDEYVWNSSPTATSNVWSAAYYTISRANNVINTIDEDFSDVEDEEEQEDFNQLKGEGLFLRALSHFDLVRIYTLPYSLDPNGLGVPVVLVTENAYPTRNTVGQVYDQIVQDLEDAIDLLPNTNSRGNDRAWADVWAAKALLAKVYLYMEDWDNAAATATDVINNGPFDLFGVEDYRTYDKGGYWGSGGAGAEIIFQVDGSEANSAHDYWESISYMTNPDGSYGDIATSQDLLQLYEAGDVRLDSMFYEPSQYPGEFWTLKYAPRLGAIREFNFPVLRLSEMYLIRAEANLNGGSSPVAAIDDYNEIRTHRGLAEAGAASLQDIYDERARELCFEGNHLWDLSRTGRSLDRTDYDGASREDIDFVVGGTALQNYLWAQPIPKGETDANVNIEQNPGY